MSLAVAPVGGSWWAWWGDAAGRVRRVRLPPAARAKLPPGAPPGPAPALPAALPAALPPLSDAETVVALAGVRGVAVDPLAERLYWTGVRQTPDGPLGTLTVAGLDGRRRVTLWQEPGAEPDDVVISVQTG